MATAYSRIIRMIRIGKVDKNILGICSEIPLRREISKCPAIILAERRTARVSGRIIFLIVSIKTIKEERAIGVPLGTR